MSKKCRFCKKNNASSREHVLVNSRLKEINQFRSTNQKNDNRKKRFTQITCTECNNKLGQYEERNRSSLAYATVWKILAGNTNGVFKGAPEFLLKYSSNSCIETYENSLLNIIKSKKQVLPENTFGFDIVYTGMTDEQGMVNFGIIRQFEMINVVTEELVLKNLEIKKEIKKKIDVIIYVSYNNNRRIIVILPLLCKQNTGWNNTRYAASYKGFLVIIKKHFPRLNVDKLYKYFD